MIRAETRVALWDFILPRLRVTESCILWTGFTRKGYGCMRPRALSFRPVSAHRIIYELMIGPIPDGLTIDHLCRVRNCVNVDHLEVVTNKENVLRGEGRTAINARKTICKRGHSLSGDNLYINSSGYRNCRQCKSLLGILNGYYKKTRALADSKE